MQDQQEALALRALQLAKDLSPADQTRVFAAVANRDMATLAAIVATTEALRHKGLVAGRDIHITLNFTSQTTTATTKEEDFYPPSVGIGVIVFIAILLSLSLLLQECSNGVRTLRGDRVEIEQSQ